MKTLLAAIAIVLVASAANAHRITHGDIYRGGSHWCNWSIAKTCTRWRDNGGKSFGLGCTGPNDMRSGCRAQHRGLR
jgi:hypothetical protein